MFKTNFIEQGKGVKSVMKKSKIFLIIGCLMLVIATAFLIYALNHPEASFQLSLTVTYILYLLYLIIMISMFILGLRKKNR